jgi:hypothetical protein
MSNPATAPREPPPPSTDPTKIMNSAGCGRERAVRNSAATMAGVYRSFDLKLPTIQGVPGPEPLRASQLQTVTPIAAAATLTLCTLLPGGGDALVGGFAGTGLGGVLAPGVCTAGPALVVALQ